ncbi:MAG: NAD(P)H-dependent flavin oxidoreductase [Bryobacteraceae bacterium]
MTPQLLSRLGIERPIVQGPFGGDYSTVRLAAAVSNAGGLGSFGAHRRSPAEILETAESIRHLTTRPFALNLWVSSQDEGGAYPSREGVLRMHGALRPYYAELGIDPAPPENKVVYDFEDQARALIEARPAVFSFVFGIPSREIIGDCKRLGIILAGGATTVDEARALEQAGVDIVVASGFEAGGHRPSFLAAAEDSLMGTMSLVPQVASAVEVPVIAAGGIADARGVAAVTRLGAQAAQLGTAFLACEESGAPALHRDRLFDVAAHHTVLSRVYTGRLARAILNRLPHELRGAPLLPYPAQLWMMSPVHEAALKQGRAELMSLWSGQSSSLLRWRNVATLMAALP